MLYVLHLHREVTIAINSSFSAVSQMRFTIAQHYNSSYTFEATSTPVNVTIYSKVYTTRSFFYINSSKGCGSKTYGGFNDSTCLPCPLNSVNKEGGYVVTNCECAAGYSGQHGESCVGQYIKIGISALYYDVIFYFRLCCRDV